MTTDNNNLHADRNDIDRDTIWEELYPLLRANVRCLVNMLATSSWRGQEDDIVDDVVQETMKRILERMHKAEKGEAEPIHSPKQMMMTIAGNYCRDKRRKDRRIVRLTSSEFSFDVPVMQQDMAHPLDIVTEEVYQEGLFFIAAKEINQFPRKQRAALLSDIASRMSFDEQPTPLQEAFNSIGVSLEKHQQPLSEDPKERNRQTSLLSHAYKRVSTLPEVRKYVE